MSISRPFRRTCRPFINGRYSGRCEYVLHPKYALSPEHYIRAFLLLLKDTRELFDYIEPADGNLPCYSYRIHALLLRACVEVEANCKAILKENGYAKPGDWNMTDYRKVNASHRLSSYEIKIPNWTGVKGTRRPFEGWATKGGLPWYKAYNATKHDRHTEFKEATFEHLIDAVCAVLVLLSAQFEIHEFSSADSMRSVSGANDGTEMGIGRYFRVRFPADWETDFRYEFVWKHLEKEADPFQNFDYSSVWEAKGVKLCTLHSPSPRLRLIP